MASKTDTSTAGRSAPAKGIPDPKIKRALEWIERLLTSVKKLKDRADNEQTHYCFSGWALNRENIAAAKAVASSLESIDYPGEAARIRSFCESLIIAGNEMLVLDDPAYVPVGAFSYRVGAASYDVAALERALLEVQDVVCRDANAVHHQGNQGAHSKGSKTKATVAARMIDLIKDPATHTWTAEQFRVKVGCKSRSTVTNTAAWKQLAVARESARLQTAQRAYDMNLDKRRRPKRKGRPERLGD